MVVLNLYTLLRKGNNRDETILEYIPDKCLCRKKHSEKFTCKKKAFLYEKSNMKIRYILLNA